MHIATKCMTSKVSGQYKIINNGGMDEYSEDVIMIDEWKFGEGSQ